MPARTRLIATVAWAAFAAAPTSGLADEPECGAFALKGGEKAINLVDNSPDGSSVGDVRAGSRQLVDNDGNTIGAAQFVATLTALPSAKTGSVFASQYFVKFANGWIASQSVYELADARDISQRAGNAILVVSGGTGAFENASGSITIEAGDPPTYVFDLSCN